MRAMAGETSAMEMESLANRIRETCVRAALQAYEDAGMQGLCEEGRLEAAIDALRTVDLAPLLRELKQPADDGRSNKNPKILKEESV